MFTKVFWAALATLEIVGAGLLVETGLTAATAELQKAALLIAALPSVVAYLAVTEGFLPAFRRKE